MSKGEDPKNNGSAFFVNTNEIKTIKVKVGGTVGTFRYRPLTARESGKILAKCSTVNGRTGEMRLDFGRYYVEFLMAQLVEAPFSINRENLGRLSPAVMDELHAKIRAGHDIGNANDDKENDDPPSVI